MFNAPQVTDEKGMILIEDPPFARYVFQSATGVVVFVWLAVRLFMGAQWLQHGYDKFVNPAWVDGTGSALTRYWTNAVAVNATGTGPVVYDWYRGFLQFLLDANVAPWFSRVIVFGELAVGLGILLGAFVGIAAAGGLLMNAAFLLAGSASTNPVLAGFEILLILAWKNAGYIGLDRYLLPRLGTPWPQPVRIAQPTPHPRAA